MDGLKIVELRAQNIKRLKAIHIKPDGAVVTITGANGAGKSSVLDAIEYALCGKTSIPSKPIRDGEQRATVDVTLDGCMRITVSRVFTPAGSRLEIRDANGDTARSPQTLLDTIVGAIAFDPLDFINSKDRTAQRQALIDLAGLDLEAHDAGIAEIRENRNAINRSIKNAEAAKAHLPARPADLPAEAISIAALMDELEKGNAHNRLKNELDAESAKAMNFQRAAEQALDAIRTDIADRHAEIAKLQAEVADMESKVPGYEQDVDAAQKAAAWAARKAGDFSPVDTAAISQAIREAEQTNRQIGVRDKHVRLDADLEQLRADLQTINNELAKAEADKAAAIAGAAMPIPGLTFSETEVVYEGIPLSQVNDAKKLEIGIAVSMAMNPKLRVIKTSANGLDSRSLARISDMVKGAGYQLWLERVDESGQVGIVIEDGEVKPCASLN